ncbi:MAG: ABC transporter [Bacillota bacterium]|nr:MAG: ABC transporter [Bacillota bacterium]
MRENINYNKTVWSNAGRIAGATLKYFLLALFAILIILPLLWVLMSAFKTTSEIMSSPFAFPKQLAFENFVNAWQKASMGSYFLNSILITAGGLVLLLVLSVPCAYTLSRFKFKGVKALRIIFMSGLFININYIVLPLFLMLFGFGRAIGVGTAITNNYFTVMLLYATTSLSFSIYLMSSYFTSLSASYEEAAKIDGCGYFKSFLYVCAPLAMPSIVTVILFNFLSFWNEYILAQTFLDSAKYTLPVGLLKIMRESRVSNDLGRMYAGLLIVIVPVLIVYGFVQGQLTKGVTVGGIKG